MGGRRGWGWGDIIHGNTRDLRIICRAAPDNRGRAPPLPTPENRIESKRVEVQHNDSIPRLIDRYGRPRARQSETPHWIKPILLNPVRRQRRSIFRALSREERGGTDLPRPRIRGAWRKNLPFLKLAILNGRKNYPGSRDAAPVRGSSSRLMYRATGSKTQRYKVTRNSPSSALAFQRMVSVRAVQRATVICRSRQLHI